MFKYFLFAAYLVAAFAAPLDDDQHAKVMMDIRENDGKGHFHYGFDISNGVGADEVGDDKGQHGEYHYISKEGIPIKVTWTADENGYHASGDSLPTPPPTPPAILKALKYLEEHPPPKLEDKDKYNKKN